MVPSTRYFPTRWLLPFVLSFAALQGLWQLARGGPVEIWVVHDFTVQPAVSLINWLTPGVHAQAMRFSIEAFRFRYRAVAMADKVFRSLRWLHFRFLHQSSSHPAALLRLSFESTSV